MKCDSFASKAKHKVTLRRPVNTVTDMGGALTSFQTIGTFWAIMEPKSGREFFAQGSVQNRVTHQIIIRYKADYKNIASIGDWFFEYDGRRFSVQSIMNLDKDMKSEGKDFQKFFVEENGVVQSEYVAPIVPQPLRVAEVQGRVIINWSSAGAGNNRHATYQPSFVPYAMKSLATLMQGWVFRQYANGYHNLPNAFTVEKMWIECPNGNVVLVKWAGGRTKLVNAGDNDVVSDEIVPFEGGYASEFPAGTYIIKSEISFTSGGSIPFVKNIFNVVPRFYNSSNTALTADTAGPLVFTGTPASTVGDVGFKPVLLGRATTARPHFIGIGDSIADGEGGDNAFSSLYGNGFMQRAMGNGGVNALPCLNFSSHSVRTWLYKQEEDPNIGKWVTLLKYANHAVVELSTNDLIAYPSNILEADIKEVWAILRAGGIQTITQSPLLAYTNSTDNWATSANQTAANAAWGAPSSKRSIFNAMLATELGLGTINYLVNTSTLLDPTDTWKWRTNGSAKFTNDDEIRPNANGHALLATALRSILTTIT